MGFWSGFFFVPGGQSSIHKENGNNADPKIIFCTTKPLNSITCHDVWSQRSIFAWTEDVLFSHYTQELLKHLKCLRRYLHWERDDRASLLVCRFIQGEITISRKQQLRWKIPLQQKESMMILMILYCVIRCKSAMQPSPSCNSCLTFHNGRVYIGWWFSYPVTVLFLEKYTTHSQKFPAGSPHGLDFETLIRGTLGPALFSLLYSVEASGNKPVKTGETGGFKNTAVV